MRCQSPEPCAMEDLLPNMHREFDSTTVVVVWSVDANLDLIPIMPDGMIRITLYKPLHLHVLTPRKLTSNDSRLSLPSGSPRYCHIDRPKDCRQIVG